jgi:hypothetical protein
MIASEAALVPVSIEGFLVPAVAVLVAAWSIQEAGAASAPARFRVPIDAAALRFSVLLHGEGLFPSFCR